MISLRNYQEDCLRAVLAALREHRSVCLVCPTGSGKRRMAMWLMQYAAQNHRRALFLGNRRLLINQAATEAEEHGLEYGTIMADLMQGDPGARNQIASIHTLESWYLRETWKKEAGVGLPPADLLLIDEGHQCLDKYAKLRTFYPEAKLVSFTATPLGPDGRAIAPSPYEVLIEPVFNSQLIRDGWLLPTTVYAPSEPHLTGVKITKGEYVQSQLGRAVQTCTLSADVFREWERVGGREMATVVFVPGVAYGRDLERQFNYYLGGNKAHVIEAKTKPAERERILRGIADRGDGVLISVDVLREGFDLPLLQCAVDLQPNQQLRSYWQKLGRIKRPHGSQNKAVCLDFAGNYWRFPHPNEDPEWPQGEETSQERIQKQREAGKEAQPIMCPQCSLVRNRGDTCPGCGFKNPQAIRRVRMGNGELREMPAVTTRRELGQEERLFNKWQGRLYAAIYCGHTFKQAAFFFHKETGQYPQEGWLGVHPQGDVKWTLPVADYYDRRNLTIACSRYKEQLRGP